MKSGKDKKKNLTIDRILDETINEVIGEDNNGILHTRHSFKVPKPLFTIPKPFHVWCHCCNEGFMSIDAYQEHLKKDKTKHERNKEIYLQVKT